MNEFHSDSSLEYADIICAQGLLFHMFAKLCGCRCVVVPRDFVEFQSTSICSCEEFKIKKCFKCDVRNRIQNRCFHSFKQINQFMSVMYRARHTTIFKWQSVIFFWSAPVFQFKSLNIPILEHMVVKSGYYLIRHNIKFKTI